jgi:hypothetical protein
MGESDMTKLRGITSKTLKTTKKGRYLVEFPREIVSIQHAGLGRKLGYIQKRCLGRWEADAMQFTARIRLCLDCRPQDGRICHPS